MMFLPDPQSLLLASTALLLAALLLASIRGRSLMGRIGSLNEAGKRLGETVQRLRARERTLLEAERAKDEFIATLGHELRNPLGALAAAAQLLDRFAARESPPARQAVETVGRQTEYMSRLVEDLLDVSRVMRGKVSLNREPLDLARLVEGCVDEMRAAGRLARHDLSLELAEVRVRADAARMKQVVTNLIGNAVKYTPEGGHVAVSLRRDGAQALLRVRDTGIGMAAELVARVFDLWVQGAPAVTRGGGGLGIGLTLVKHLVELQGGKVFAASSGPGEGSVFTVALPACIGEVPSGYDAHSATAEVRGFRILVVEDNDDLRHSLAGALAVEGHHVFEARSGEVALQLAAAEPPGVALVDLALPGIDGFEVARKLRRASGGEDRVLIALTGYGQSDYRRRAHEAGFDQFVLKPVSPQYLLQLVRAVQAQRTQRERPLQLERSEIPRSAAPHPA